jgi:thiol-disulfide isomerase/thioredoxin
MRIFYFSANFNLTIMPVIDANDVNFSELVKSNEKVVVKFYAGWCGSCRLFAPKFKRISNDEKYSGITFLDVNAEENPEARKAAGVTNLPFFAVFKNGEQKASLSTSKEEAFVELLASLN